MQTNFVTTGLIYIVIGFALALFFYYVLKKKFIGKVWGAVFVGIVGSFVGGICDFFIPQIRFFTLIFYSVNIIPSCLMAALFLWVFHKISVAPEPY